MSKNIYVGNMNYSTSEDDLRDLFEQYGTVESVKIISDRDTGRSKGFGFVEMENAEEADSAISALNSQEVGGRQLRVNEANDRPKRNRDSW
ncbi:MAG: RNA recognition motif domain-containing protein [Spirochaetia bacterium]